MARHHLAVRILGRVSGAGVARGCGGCVGAEVTNAHTLAATVATGKDDWQTPPAVLDALDAEFGFWLDAASDRLGGFGAYLGPGSEFGEDGRAEWPAVPLHAPPVAWLNSPYSRALGGLKVWHERAWEQSRRGWTVVVLCPPHMGRQWFQQYGWRCDEMRIYKRRLAFIDPATGKQVRGNTQDSGLFIYRPHVPEQGWPGGPRLSLIDVPTGAA
jgi:phage N-6-adenine-methyltransferase